MDATLLARLGADCDKIATAYCKTYVFDPSTLLWPISQTKPTMSRHALKGLEKNMKYLKFEPTYLLHVTKTFLVVLGFWDKSLMVFGRTPRSRRGTRWEGHKSHETNMRLNQPLLNYEVLPLLLFKFCIHLFMSDCIRSCGSIVTCGWRGVFAYMMNGAGGGICVLKPCWTHAWVLAWEFQFGKCPRKRIRNWVSIGKQSVALRICI